MTRYMALKQWIRETIKSRYGSEPTINPLIPSQDTNVTQHLVYDEVHHDYLLQHCSLDTMCPTLVDFCLHDCSIACVPACLNALLD